MIKPSNNSPTKLKYIFAFIITNFVINMFLNGTSIITFGNVSDVDSFENAYIMHSIISFFANTILYIVSYNFIFKNLNFKKVIIYLYILSPLGLLVGFAKLLSRFDKQGFELPDSTFQLIVISATLSMILSILAIRFFFKKKKERWF